MESFSEGILNLRKFEGMNYSRLIATGFDARSAALICGLNTMASQPEFKDIDLTEFSINVERHTQDGKPYVYAVKPINKQQAETLRQYLGNCEPFGIQLPVQFNFPSNWSNDTQYEICHAITEHLKGVIPFVQNGSEPVPVPARQSGFVNNVLNKEFTDEERKAMFIVYTPDTVSEANKRFKIQQLYIPPETPALRAKAVALAKKLNLDYPNPPDTQEPLVITGKALEELIKLGTRRQLGLNGDSGSLPNL